jgi:ubiquinol-cytochrome c reductase cytochrome b/c1 subunit
MADRPRNGFKSPVVTWIDTRLPVFTLMQKEYGTFPTPKNFNYLWNFGALATVALAIMIVTGVFLAMNYQPNTAMAFDSVQHIMRDVNYGWMIRYIHLNGASMFFIVVYIHIFRGLYYGSYKAPRELLWMLGVVLLLLLMMATAFTGYVLPWSQMSYWGATVITNLFSAIPVVGKGVVTWLWGGFAVDSPTLNRFFSLHYLLPFVIIGVVFLHIAALHVTGSNNLLGIDVRSPQDTLPFHPYYTVKDSVGLCVFLTVFAGLVFFVPNLLNDLTNFEPANALVTPQSVVPQWYFLPFYAILRSIHSKPGGVLLMFGAVGVLFVLSWLDTNPVRSARFRPVYRQLMAVLVADVILLGVVGAHEPAGVWIVLGRVATLYYFLHFLVLFTHSGETGASPAFAYEHQPTRVGAGRGRVGPYSPPPSNGRPELPQCPNMRDERSVTARQHSRCVPIPSFRRLR